jgi:hypothetical protein
MAAVVKNKELLLCNSPLLIKKYWLTQGVDHLDVTHGEDRSPDMVIITNAMGADPTTTEMSFTHTSATVITFEGEAAAGSMEAYLIWISQGSGGIS